MAEIVFVLFVKGKMTVELSKGEHPAIIWTGEF